MLASNPGLIEDVKKAPEDILSFRVPAREVRMLPSTLRLDSHSLRSFKFLQIQYTMNPLNLDDSYHVDIIRTKLTRNIADLFKDVRDELVRSLDASIPTSGDGA